jgi:CRP-like cAMP-binding protein
MTPKSLRINHNQKRSIIMNVVTKSKIEDHLSPSHFYTGISLDDFPVKERAELEQQSKIISLPRKSALYTEGEAPKGVYVLLKGKIKFSQLNFDGSVQILYIFSAGEMFGHRSLLSDEKHSVSAVALEDCEILCIDKDHFLEVLRSSPRLSNLLLKSICHEVTVLGNRINIFAQRSIKERLAYFLLILNQKYKAPGQITEESEIKVNRSDLASYTGTSLENLVRTLKDFRTKNYIRTDGKSIYINDFDALYSLTGV